MNKERQNETQLLTDQLMFDTVLATHRDPNNLHDMKGKSLHSQGFFQKMTSSSESNKSHNSLDLSLYNDLSSTQISPTF